MATTAQVLAVEFSDDATQLFVGGVDETIKCFDIRMERVVYTLEGHADFVTGMSLSNDGSFLLTNR